MINSKEAYSTFEQAVKKIDNLSKDDLLFKKASQEEIKELRERSETSCLRELVK